MKNAIILHGQPGKEEYYDPERPSMSNAHWIAWLQAQLLKNDIAAATPEVPFAFKPDWDLWVQEVERFDINSDTLIVGHSRGCDFWLRWLSEHTEKKVGKVVLVAPGLGYLTKDDNYFGKFELDPNLVERTDGITIFNSDDDNESIQQAVREIRNVLKNVGYKEFHLRHFTFGSMGTDKFPELLEEALK